MTEPNIQAPEPERTSQGAANRAHIRWRLLPWALPALLVLFWWLAAEAAIFPPILLPAPQTVFSRALDLLSSGELFRHAGTSLARVAAGFLISAALALGSAFLFYRHAASERAASIIFESLRIIPPLSLVPLLILWLGIDEAPKLAIVVLASFFPIHLSALDALKATGALPRSRASLGFPSASTSGTYCCRARRPESSRGFASASAMPGAPLSARS